MPAYCLFRSAIHAVCNRHINKHMCIRIYFHVRSLCNFSQMYEFFARVKSNFLLKISYLYLYKCVWLLRKARIPQQNQINALAYIFQKIYISKPCIGSLFLIEFSFAILPTLYMLTAKKSSRIS